MRSSLSCAVISAMVAAAAPAAASPEGDVEALVRTTIDHVADASSAAGFAKGATVFGLYATEFVIPIEIDAAEWSPFVNGRAWLPISKNERDGVIQFGFTVYAVQEKGEWRWRSIQFACDQVPARD
jgi:hypothetical protein